MTARRSGELARLRADLASARARAFPVVLVVEVFRDDPSAEALCYINDVEALFRRASPESVVVVIQPEAARPPGLVPPWQPGRRAFFEWHPSRDEWANPRPDLLPDRRHTPRADYAPPPSAAPPPGPLGAPADRVVAATPGGGDLGAGPIR